MKSLYNAQMQHDNIQNMARELKKTIIGRLRVCHFGGSEAKAMSKHFLRKTFTNQR